MRSRCVWKMFFQYHFRFISLFSLPQISWKMKREAVEAVIYSCIKGLDGRIPACKLKNIILIFVAGSLLEAMDWTGSKAVAITVSKICVSLQMVHGGRWKSIATKKTLVTIKMGLSFVWSSFMLSVFPQEGYWLHGVFNSL